MEQPAVDDLETGFDRLLVESDDDIEETLRNDSFRNNAMVLPTDNVSDTESETLSISNSESEDEWISDAEVHDEFVFSQQVGPYDCVHSCREPIDFYELYLNGEMLSLIVGETNRQGKAKDSNFQDTCPAEIKKFMGLCIQMGVVQMPKLRDYWSTRPAIGGHSIAGKVMPRTRFEQLLNSLHFADNNQFDGNRLCKINDFLELFNANCEKAYRPEKEAQIWN
ncbi:hypothetical protein V3C99_017788 [Haemonchus contortus]